MPAKSTIPSLKDDCFDTSEQPEVLIAQAGRHIQDMMTAVLRRHGLKLVEWRILQCLRTGGILSICDLSDLANVDRTVTSRLVDRLSERGLLIKKALKSDRRFAQISLSRAGCSLLDAAGPDMQKARQRLLRDISPAELDAMARTLGTFISNARPKR